MKNKTGLKIRTGLVLLFFYCYNSFGQVTPLQTWVDQTYNADVKDIGANPLKGMMPFSSSVGSATFPFSMEWFYLPLRQIQTDYNSFNWSSIESQLQSISGRGHQAAFRIYLDYPGEPIGTPQFLIDAGVSLRSYSDYGNASSKAPDWNNPKLISALTSFIKALGIKYDGDPRVAYLTVGLYGFWGEWHTYPYDSWSMTQDNKNLLLNAYKSAFTKTKVVLRDPLGSNDATLKNSFGYHDDSFAYETLSPNWAFWPKIQQNGLAEIWKTQIIGGELRPEIQSTVWNNWPNTSGEDMNNCIQTTHISWFINNWIFENKPSANQYGNALKAVKMMGYSFYISSVKLNSASSGNINLDVKIQNKGVAPIAYNWDVEFAAFNLTTKEIISLGRESWALTDILPGTNGYMRSFVSNQTLNMGNYALLMHIVNPLSNGNSLRFANDKQDLNMAGWLSLASFQINLTTSLKEDILLPDNGFNCYPNPAKDKVKLKASACLNYVLIKNAAGKIVYENTIPDNYTEIEISSFEPGSYSIVTQFGVHKLIVQ